MRPARPASDPSLRAWFDLGGEQTLLSYPCDGTNFIDPDNVRFIQGCRDHFETDNFILTHANVNSDLPMDRQSSSRLRWEHVEPGRQRPHASGKTVIVGHTPRTNGRVLDLGHLLCLDTDCSRGG